MAGLETNLGELLLTAAQVSPGQLCLETEDAGYTFEQIALMVAGIRRVLRKALSSLAEPLHPGSPLRAHERRADEHVVTIVLERGVKSLASIHAAMLERCAYNAFDVAEPVEKLQSWIDVCHPAVIISTQALFTRLHLDALSKSSQFPQYVLDVDWALKCQQKPIAAKCDQEDLDRLAYLIFTSGSTGKPKAVMIRHASALNVARVWSAAIGLCSADRFAQISSMSWDVHVIEIYGAMAAQATSVTCPDIVKQSGPDMLLWLRHKQITGMSAVPSHLRTMQCSSGPVSSLAGPALGVNLPQLRIVDVGGEALGADVVSTWAPGRLLFNSYGPTEISVVCTGIDVQVGDPITLGPALPGYECHILDPNTLAMKELGEVGILFVGGVGLARGYLGEEGKTNEKFIELPGLGRLFNTGDLAFKDQENRLHYRGRVDSQVKVRGLRIELEALESAIMDLGTVKHCEARVLEGRLVLLASLASGSLCSEELKAKAMSLGRGYVLSQVKVVDDTAWKFSSGGKLVRNVVPWGDLEKTAGDAFDRVGASALELEIAACVARVVGPLESWDRNSHFVDDLGIDSAGMGQLLGQIRGTKHRQKADLRALFEHPTVSALALFLSDPESDSEEENLDSEHGGKNLVGTIWKSMQANPHNICCELPCSCLSYMQLFRLATAFQRQLRRDSTTTGCRGPVAICLDMMTERMAAMLAVLMEGRAFCVLDEGHGFADQLQVFNVQCILASSKDAVWAWLQEICQDTQEICCIDVSSASLPLQVSMKMQAVDLDDACFHYVHEDLKEDEASVSGACGQKLTALTASHRALLEVLDAWPELQRTQVKLPAAIACLALLKILLSGGVLVNRVDRMAEPLVCHESADNGRALTSLPVLFGQKACLLVTPQEVSAVRDSLFRTTRDMMTALLFPGLLGVVTHSFGENSWPVLCAVVQGIVIVVEPVLMASRMMLAERVLLPLTFVVPLWQSFLLLWAIIICEKILRVIVLLAAKWVLIGRYKEAKHDIYSLFYLRHWLVERIADGTIIGTETPPGTSVAFHFLRNLVLRALGADVALTAMIFTRVVAFDLVSVGHLATVNGLKRLTAVNYGEGKMVLKSISVGEGAFVGANSLLEPGSRVAAASHVEALSMVPGSKVSGRVAGVPAESIECDAAKPRSIPLASEVRSFRLKAALMASTYWLFTPQAVIPFITVMIFQLEAGSEDSVDFDLERFDSLPESVLSFLPQLPLWSFAFTLLILALQLLLTALICRLLPRVKPPCSYLLTSVRGQMVSLKMLWINQASKLLQDASMVPAFMRMCGARFGRGVSIAAEVMLPDTLVVGNGCFIATRNILTSATVDQGQFRVPCVTHLGDNCFVGNDNCLPAGLPEGSFCGLNTSLPKRPDQKNLGYFGTPAMTFKRPSSLSKDGSPEEDSTAALWWFHFSTNVIDIFILRGLQAMVVASSLVMSRCLFPSTTNTSVLAVLFMVTLIYLLMKVASWLAFSVVLGRLLYNEAIPTSSTYHSTTVTRWFTSIMLQKFIFTSPFRTAGTHWHAHHFRLRGAKIGQRFFCVHDNALVDAPFISIGNDVIVDYDADIRGHSFEDRRLKFSPVTIGNRARIMAAAKVAMSDVGEGAVLRPASVTWKGNNLEPNRVYQGAPAVEASAFNLGTSADKFGDSN